MKSSLEWVLHSDVGILFDHFSRLFGIRIAFFSLDGRELKTGIQKSICPYCLFLRERFSLENVCLKQDHDMRQRASASGEMTTYTCHAGLMEVVYPILAGEKLIGYVMIGQFRTENSQMGLELPSNIRDRSDVQKLYQEVPVFSKEKVEPILAMFTVMVRYMIDQRFIHMKGDEMVRTIISYMEEHPEKHLSLSEAAKFISKSTSTVTHLFQKVLGKSFKQTQVDIKLNIAEGLFFSMPRLSISEVAMKVGYDDPLYFSRLFRKYRGISPRQYIKKKWLGSN